MPNINHLTYNGTKSTDLGVYVTGSGSFDAAELDVDRYEIPGRNGDLIIPKKRYKNIKISYPAFIPKEFQNDAQSIRNWLRSSKTYARLEDSYDMNHYRLGISSGIQSFEPANRNDASNFEMVFDCKPQRFLKTGETPQNVVPEAHSYSGDIVSFETVAVDDMTKAEVTIAPIQSGSGDPSPTNIRPITGHDSATLNIGAEYPTPDDSYPVTFPQTVYGGTFDWVSGKLVVTWKGVDMGDISYTLHNNGYFWRNISDKKPGGTNMLCSVYKVDDSLPAANLPDGTIRGGTSTTIYFKDSRFANAGAAQTGLTGQTLVYELATPIEIDLTPAQVQTLLGLNNVWADNGQISVEYADPFNIENPTFFDASPLFEVTNPAANDVLSVNTTDITFTTGYTGTVVIDCETMNCYAGFSNLNYLISATEFPVLEPGLNILKWTGSGTVKMTPRWWEL